MSDWYVLEGGEILGPFTTEEWIGIEKKETPHIGDDTIGAVRISTVFLNLDHAFLDGTTPVLFETMIFGGELDQEQFRYTTIDEARAGHAAAVAAVKKTLN